MNDSVNSDLIHTDNIQVAVAPMAPVLGALLQGAREQHGLSMEDISNRLRLSPRQVQALESDDFSALPEAMITRGFIRNYARLLGLDAEPLLQAYRELVPSSDSPRAISIESENILISGSNKRPWRMYMLASLAIALLLGVWLIYVDYFPHQSAKLVPATEVEATAKTRAATEPGTYTELLPMAALPAAERLAEGKATAAAPSPATQPETKAAPATPVVAGEAATSRTSNPAPAGANALARLKFTFSDHTWVSVIDRNNKEIFNKTKPAGSEETVEGLPPFKVTIGNAAGSKLVFNDKPVDLAPYTKLNVAHLTLE